MSNRTKIVCTMGPAVDSPEMIVKLIQAGMNGARLNFSHGTYDEHQVRIDRLKAARRDLEVPLAIILDTKGPEVRLGKLFEDRDVIEGEKFLLVDQESYDKAPIGCLPLNPFFVAQEFTQGAQLLIDDGYLSARVERSSEGTSICFLNAGRLKSRKSMNLPGAKLSLPAITEKDKNDLLFAIKNEVDWIAASFVRSAQHMFEIKRFLADNGGSMIKVAAKIENQEGVDHFDEILDASDGIMVARGDLGVEVPIEQVPKLQKMMIHKSQLAGKPVVTATQMLESMIQNPRPTRAEVSDVANAIYDSSSAVMLSGETAVGKYPIETVKMMHKVAAQAEADFNYREFFKISSDIDSTDVTSSIAMAAVKTAFSSQVKAIICMSHGGRTAQMIARHRPAMKIIANTTDPRVYHQLALTWGVEPVLTESSSSMAEGFYKMSSLALKKGWVSEGDLVLMTAGHPFGKPGSTSVMMLEYVGDVLVRGMKGFGASTKGKALRLLTPTSASIDKGHILVLNHFNESFESCIQAAGGAVIEQLGNEEDLEKEAERVFSKLQVPIILCAPGTAESLIEGAMIRLDPSKALVMRIKPIFDSLDR